MEISEVRCVRREGTLDSYPDGILSERLARPTDRYEEYRESGPEKATQESGDPYHVDQHFLEIETASGVTGIAGPLGPLWARTAYRVSQTIVGENSLATERIADIMYGRWGDSYTGLRAKGISALDIALWDIRGKHYGAPVYELLGGPTRDELPCYASMLGFSVDPEDARERAMEYHDRGFPAQKWFFRHGPGSGTEGIEQNMALVEAVSDATPDGYDLMFDCWRSWGTAYAQQMLDRLAPFEPRWLEQPIDSQYEDQLARLASQAPFPISGGEHNTTRWDFHDLLSANALDVLQPDTYYTGGISEMQKICTLASAQDVPVVPHGHSVPANIHVIASQPPSVCPLVEFLIQRNALYQHFFDEPVMPDAGHITLPDRPGIGVEIDADAIEAEEELTF